MSILFEYYKEPSFYRTSIFRLLFPFTSKIAEQLTEKKIEINSICLSVVAS